MAHVGEHENQPRTAGDRPAVVPPSSPVPFRRLLERWFDPCVDVAWQILQDVDVAAEVTQDAFLAAWHAHVERRPERAGTWLLRATRDEALGRLAKRPPVPEHARDDTDATRAAAAVLGEKDASVLDLHVRHGLDVTAVAEALRVTEGDARALIFRLRRRLGAALRAWVLWPRASTGAGACAALRGAVGAAGVTAFGPEAVNVVSQHAKSCSSCRTRQRRAPAPETLFADVPIVPAGTVLATTAATALAAHGVPVGEADADVPSAPAAAPTAVDATAPPPAGVTSPVPPVTPGTDAPPRAVPSGDARTPAPPDGAYTATGAYGPASGDRWAPARHHPAPSPAPALPTSGAGDAPTGKRRTVALGVAALLVVGLAVAATTMTSDSSEDRASADETTTPTAEPTPTSAPVTTAPPSATTTVPTWPATTAPAGPAAWPTTVLPPSGEVDPPDLAEAPAPEITAFRPTGQGLGAPCAADERRLTLAWTSVRGESARLAGPGVPFGDHPAASGQATVCRAPGPPSVYTLTVAGPGGTATRTLTA